MEQLYIKRRNGDAAQKFREVIFCDTKRGQSLIEILIAVTVAGILVGGAAALISVILQSGTQSRYFQTASALAQDLLEKVSLLGEARWYCDPVPCGLYGIPSSVEYYIGTTTTPFTPRVGRETLVVDGISYERSYMRENLSRTLCGVGEITTDSPGGCINGPGSPGVADDPSTQKITVFVRWSGPGSAAQTFSIAKYITRSRNNVFNQSDWIGDGGQAGPITSPNEKFWVANGIDFGIQGEIKASP